MPERVQYVNGLLQGEMVEVYLAARHDQMANFLSSLRGLHTQPASAHRPLAIVVKEERLNHRRTAISLSTKVRGGTAY